MAALWRVMAPHPDGHGVYLGTEAQEYAEWFYSAVSIQEV